MDHWQRIEAAIAGQATDRVPVALWRHFPGDDQDAAKLAARVRGLGAEPMSGRPADFAKLYAEEYARWAEVVRVSGAKID